jgi:hypothetical protein
VQINLRRNERKRMQKKALLGQVYAVERRGIGIFVFQARDRANGPSYGQLENQFCLTRDYAL